MPGSVPIMVSAVLAALLAAAGAVRLVAADPPAVVDYTKISPVDLVRSTPKGTLVNPYRDTQTDIVADGETLFRSYACSACHGATGGGGLCPPVTNATWVYGGDDDTLFRLVALGTDEMQKQGYSRTGRENIVAPMPAFGAGIKSSDELWKIFAYIRARYEGDPDHKFGTAASHR